MRDNASNDDEDAEDEDEDAEGQYLCKIVWKFPALRILFCVLLNVIVSRPLRSALAMAIL